MRSEEVLMMPTSDAIYIVTKTAARAEAIKQAIGLRDIDEVICIPLENAPLLLKANPPALTIIDAEGDPEKTAQLMTQLPAAQKSLVLADQFDEELFVTCHDHGARDFLVKPVPDAYLMSRVLRLLQQNRLEQLVEQKDRILEELGVLSPRSGVFTTSYLLKLLKKEAEAASPYLSSPLSLLIVQLEGYQSPLHEEVQTVLYTDIARILKECSRGLDMVGEYFMDKFAVILPQTEARGARALAKRLTARLNGYEFQAPEGPLRLKVRIGLSEYTGCRHYEDLLNRALEDLRGSETKSLHAV
jgi:diguanylate cyclase (GGDEF)-like protein